MKKTVWLSIILAFTLTFTACSTNREYSSESLADYEISEADSASGSSGANSTEPFSSADSSAATSSSSSSQSSGQIHELVPELTSDYDEDFFKNDLFIGDSIFTGLYLYSYIDRDNVAAVGGYTPWRAANTAFDEDFYIGSAADYAEERQPAHIIIMLGSNGLTPQTDQEEYADDYRDLLDRLTTDCPDSAICAVSVPPITANSSMAGYSGITNELIDSLNEKISALCSELGVAYCDLNSVLKDDKGYFNEEYVYDDGMHFVGKTYPVLLSRVQKTLEAAAGGAVINVSRLSKKTLALAEALELSSMVEVTFDELDIFYDIVKTDVDDFSAYLCGSGAVPDEFGAFAAKDADAAKRIADALERRIEYQRKVFKDYIPGEMYKFDDCFVEIDENTVIYAICADNPKARELLSR